MQYIKIEAIVALDCNFFDARTVMDQSTEVIVLGWEETEMYLTPVCEGCPECEGGKS
jgi:hypothetical protein